MKRYLTPDRWIIVKYLKDGVMQYRVISGWFSSMALAKETWKISSNITELAEDSHAFLVRTEQKTTYTLMKNQEGTTPLAEAQFARIKEERQAVIININEIYQND